MRSALSHILFFTIILFSSNTIFGQKKNDTTSLTEIIVKASPINTSLQNSISSITFIERSEINKSDGIILTPILNKVAGLYMQQGSLNTNRITIRGIGARSQYGSNRIKAYFEDIPLTNAEGETDLEDIDLETIGTIEIIKGPNSNSFGSGLGGVIHLSSNTNVIDKMYAKSTSTIGSYGLFKQSISGGYHDEKSNLYLSYNQLQSEGYRANSTYDRKSIHINGKQQIAKGHSLSILTILTRLKAFIPSSINIKDYQENPRKAANSWAAAQGFESYDKLLIGISDYQQLSTHWQFKTSVYSNLKNAFEPRPFDILDDETSYFGLRSSLNHDGKLFKRPFKLSLGTELAAEKYTFSLSENLYQLQPKQGSVLGNKLSSFKQNRQYANYFIAINFLIFKKLHLESGVNLNHSKYDLKDTFELQNNSNKQSYTFGKIYAPRVGFSYKLSDGKNLSASISKGFSIPSVAETLQPDGQINTDLKSEIGWNYELGFKGNWFAKGIYTEVSLFDTQIKNLLVANSTTQGQFMGINAGKSAHLGLEFLINAKILENHQFKIDAYFSGALNRFRLKNFVNMGINYSGNQLTGTPNKQINLGVDIKINNGFSLNSSLRSVGKIPLNDANTIYSNAYQVIDVKGTYVKTFLKVFKTEFNIGLNNITNKHYAASILPNAVGFGNTLPRYYYPGNARNYFVGIAVKYILKSF